MSLALAGVLVLGLLLIFGAEKNSWRLKVEDLCAQNESLLAQNKSLLDENEELRARLEQSPFRRELVVPK